MLSSWNDINLYIILLQLFLRPGPHEQLDEEDGVSAALTV
jgi:hypothetical protein